MGPNGSVGPVRLESAVPLIVLQNSVFGVDQKVLAPWKALMKIEPGDSHKFEIWLSDAPNSSWTQAGVHIQIQSVSAKKSTFGNFEFCNTIGMQLPLFASLPLVRCIPDN